MPEKGDSITREDAEKLKRLLQLWGYAPTHIRRMEAELRDMESAIGDARETLKSQNITDMPKGSRKKKSPVEQAEEAVQHRIDAYVRRTRIVTRDSDETLAIRAAIDEARKGFTIDEQRAIDLKYQDRYPWEIVAVRMSKSVSRVRAIGNDALQKLRAKKEIWEMAERQALLSAD